MDELTASRTAQSTALMRAAHTRLDAKSLIHDPWGDLLVPDATRAALRSAALGRMDDAARAQAALASPQAILDQHLLSNRAYENVITRTRYSEDALQAAVARGIQQYVLIGAGFDSFVLRRPAFARDLTIFEIDHPATQDLKRKRIKSVGFELPPSVHFVAVDFARETVAAALARSAFRSDRQTFFSWLGVTMYLTREANLATLEAVSGFAAAGSELVFTYLDGRLFDAPTDAFSALRNAVAALGEPFLSGFDPRQLPQLLQACGMTLIEDLDGEQIAQRFGRERAAGAGQSSFSHIALSRVD